MNKRFIALILSLLAIWNIILSIILYQETKKSPDETTVNENIIEGFSTDLTRVNDDIKTAIVSVYSEDELMSGFVYAVTEEEVYIITAYHGLNDEDEINIIFDNDLAYQATLIGYDDYADLAVLAVKPPFKVNPLPQGDPFYLQKGEYLLTFATPGSLDYQATVSLALMNESECVLERSFQNADVNEHYYAAYLQLTSTLNPGSSGGPIVNMAGEVMGMTLMDDPENEGIVLAVPINEIALIADQLIDGQSLSRTTFGIKGSSITRMENYERSARNIPLDITEGYYVKRILSNSPAEEMGLRSGDVIIAINDQKIADYRDYLKMTYASLTDWNFTIRRGEETLILNYHYD